MTIRRSITRSALAAASTLTVLAATLLSATSISAARIPRGQIASCMHTSHYKMPPTQTELKNPKFTLALQRCLTKAHVTAYTAKQLVSYDSCLITHHVVLGTTPHTSSTYKKAKTACRPALLQTH